MMGPLVEGLLLLDRLQYLTEQVSKPSFKSNKDV